MGIIFMGSLLAPDEFVHIIRLLNTNLDGKEKIMYALTKIKGIGRRFANLICKKGEIDMSSRAGDLTTQQVEKLGQIIANPQSHKIPSWFLNNRRDYKDNKDYQITSSDVLSHEDEIKRRLKKIASHRGVRHSCSLKVRGQRTKASGGKQPRRSTTER